jgi:hypothetical protein
VGNHAEQRPDGFEESAGAKIALDASTAICQSEVSLRVVGEIAMNVIKQNLFLFVAMCIGTGLLVIQALAQTARP